MPPASPTPDARPQLDELGSYLRAGAPKSPAELLDEIPAGEAQHAPSDGDRLVRRDDAPIPIGFVAFGPRAGRWTWWCCTPS